MYIVFNLITHNYPFAGYIAFYASYFTSFFFSFLNCSIFSLDRICTLRIYTGAALDTVALVLESIALQLSIT